MNEGAECEQPSLAARSLSSVGPGWACHRWLVLHRSFPSSLGWCVIDSADQAFGLRGAAVDEVLPPSGLVDDMVMGVLLKSVRYHERQHACFNQEPSSIPNTALLNGKTSTLFITSCALLFN